MGKGCRVLVLWTRESTCGIEPLNHVPESGRFVNAVTTVRFSGDKKFYPARIVMISSDDAALESKADELSVELAAEKENRKDCGKKRTRKSRAVDPSLASDRQVALALGQRAPVPLELASSKQAALRAKKLASTHHSKAQALLDHQVSNNIRRSLFAPPTDDVLEESELESALESDECDDDLNSNEEDQNCDSAWCSCPVCKLLSSYSDPKYISFLREIQVLLETRGKAEGRKFLQLLPIPDVVKKVELSSSSKVNVLISSTEKDIIKMDFKNKPSSLIRETLFALYGKEAFSTHMVTGRGNKPGTYGISDDVLKALYGFVNHNVDLEKRVKLHQIVQTINKRAPEWRKNLMSTPRPNKRRRVQGTSSPSLSEMVNSNTPNLRTPSLPKTSPQVFPQRSTLGDSTSAAQVSTGAGTPATSPSISTPDTSTASRGPTPSWPATQSVYSSGCPEPQHSSWSAGPWPQQYSDYGQFSQHYGGYEAYNDDHQLTAL